MFFTEVDVDDLANVKNISQRERADLGQVREDVGEALEVASKSIDRAMRLTVIEARMFCDGYWKMHKLMMGDNDPSQLSRIGTRVRVIGGSLQAMWYKNHFARRKGKNSFLSKHLKKPAGQNRYNLSFCDDEPEWVKDTVAEVEDNYERLRVQYRELAASKRRLVAVQKRQQPQTPSETDDNK